MLYWRFQSRVVVPLLRFDVLSEQWLGKAKRYNVLYAQRKREGIVVVLTRVSTTVRGDTVNRLLKV